MTVPHMTLKQVQIYQPELQLTTQVDVCNRMNEKIDAYNKANLVKLDVKLVTREAAIAEWESKKDTCDVWIKNDMTDGWELTQLSRKFVVCANEANCEYQLRAKPLKQVSWKDVPVGVAVQTVDKKLICTFVGMAANGLISIYNKTAGADDYRAAKFELAPAEQQSWIAVQDDDDFMLKDCFMYDKRYSATDDCELISYRITGLAEGYELK